MTDNLTPERIAEARRHVKPMKLHEFFYNEKAFEVHETIRDALAYVEAHKLKEAGE